MRSFYLVLKVFYSAPTLPLEDSTFQMSIGLCSMMHRRYLLIGIVFYSIPSSESSGSRNFCARLP